MESPEKKEYSIKYQSLKVSILLATLCYCSISHAQTGLGAENAQSYKIGETDLYPTLQVGFLENSNVNLDNVNPESAQALSILPALLWVADRRLVKLRAKYNGEYSNSEQSALTLADHRVSIEADTEFTKRERANASLSVEVNNELASQNFLVDQDDTNSDLVRSVDTNAAFQFTYGANKALGNAIAGIRLRNLDFTSRQDLTNGNNLFKFEPFAIFSLRASADTRLLAELRYAQIDYDGAVDRSEISSLIGFSFAPSGKTGSNFKLGLSQTNYDSNSLVNQNDLILEGSLFWEPTRFSRFNLTVSRRLENIESGVLTNNQPAAVRSLATLRWTHQWSSRLAHVAFVQSNMLSRNCEGLGYLDLNGGYDLNVRIKRWLTVGAGAKYKSRDADTCAGGAEDFSDQNFEQTVLNAYFRVTL